VRRSDNLTTFVCRLSRNSEASTSWNPKGLSRPVAGKLYLFFNKLVYVSMTTHRKATDKHLRRPSAVGDYDKHSKLNILVYPKFVVCIITVLSDASLRSIFLCDISQSLKYSHLRKTGCKRKINVTRIRTI
jgi:hypothetical protein